MEYPIRLMRRRTKTLIFLGILIIAAAVCLIFIESLSDMEKYMLIGILAVFLLAAAMNVVLLSEDTYHIYEDRIECVSKFLLKETVEAKNITRVEYSGDKKSILICYDRPEFNLQNFLSDVEEKDKTGMWQMVISEKDINIPIGKLKYTLNNMFLQSTKTVTKDDI